MGTLDPPIRGRGEEEGAERDRWSVRRTEGYGRAGQKEEATSEVGRQWFLTAGTSESTGNRIGKWCNADAWTSHLGPRGQSHDRFEQHTPACKDATWRKQSRVKTEVRLKLWGQAFTHGP